MTQLTKPQAHYREATEKGVNCRTCLYMRQDGTCDLVQGIVEPGDVCDHWRRAK